ncbi:MAG TPA: hypothetical protein VK151_10305 [Fluviicola sp.]|nr:hypothetical protein [Fluviicola sp.]
MIKTSILLLLLSPIAISAQTALIAHKSRSGNPRSFTISFSRNFGETRPENLGTFGIPPARMVAVTKLSDTTVLIKNREWGAEDTSELTFYNHPIFNDPNMTVDSLKMIFGADVEFINFEPKKVEERPIEPIEYKVPPGQEHLPPLGIPEKEKEKKHKKHKRNKGSMVWIWIIGGGTFLGFGLLGKQSSKRQKEEVVYA